MSAPTSSSAARALRTTQRRLIRRNGRGYASEAQEHKAHVEQSESFGKSFYLAVAAIPTAYLVWTVSRPGTDGSMNLYSKAIEKWSDYSKVWEQRNVLHTKMVEQAAADRNLFLNTPSPNHHELRYPEKFNAGSPMNVPAGHGRANVDHVTSFYKERAAKEESETLQRLKDAGKAPKSAQEPQKQPKGWSLF